MNRPTVHGYPLPEGTLPDRPEWRLTTRHFDHERCVIVEAKAWVRADGARLLHFDPWSREQLLAALDKYDREHPREAPPPLCGQVWRFDLEDITRKVGGVAEFPTHWRVWWPDSPVASLAGGPVRYSKGGEDRREWPPAGAELVAGPGAPWSPSWLVEQVEDA